MREKPYDYSEHFRPGQRARVDIPLGGNQIFCEWAVVTSIHKARLSLLLSRDVLPDGVMLTSETPVLIRTGSAGQGYRCHGEILKAYDTGELGIGLLGSVVSDEKREYYRLDTWLQAKISRETPPRFGEDWPGARNSAASEDKYNELRTSQEVNYLYHIPSDDGEEFNNDQCSTHIVNISGGGIRAEMQEKVATGDLVYVTFHLPLPQEKVVPAIAEVVHCEEMISSWDKDPHYSVGLRYVNIHERDRDSIVQYVCAEEIKKIRSCKKEFFSLPAKELSV